MTRFHVGTGYGVVVVQALWLSTIEEKPNATWTFLFYLLFHYEEAFGSWHILGSGRWFFAFGHGQNTQGYDAKY